MRISILILFLLSFCCVYTTESSIYNQEDWIELSKIHVTKHSPRQEYLVMWMNTYSQTIYPCTVNYPFPGDWSEEDRWMERYGWAGKSYPDCEWITVSVEDRVPEDAKAVYLSGLLIITTGNMQESPSMTLKFRCKGEEKEYKYCHQAAVQSTPGSVRSPMSVWIPINDKKEFEFKWTRSTYGQWPNNSAYGIALSLNAWGS